MFTPIENGSCIDIQGLDCWIPPVGYVFNVATKEYEYVGVQSRSEIPSEQKWERKPLPNWYKDILKKWKEYDKRKKRMTPNFMMSN